MNFGPAIDLGSSIEPVVAVSGSNIYMAWDTGFTGWPPSHVMFAKSTDFGKTFSPPQSLDNDPNSSGVVTQLLADGNHVFAVIDELGEKEPYKADVYLRASNDNGTTWGKEVELLTAPINNGNPLGFAVSIQKSGGNIFVAGEYPLFRKSTDLGMTFGKTQDVIRASNPNDLQMVASGNDIYLVYTALAQYGQAVFLAESHDGGDSFGLPKRLSQKMGEAEGSQIIADGNNLYAAWKFDNSNVLKGSKSSGDLPFSPVSGIFFAKSVDGGKTFSIPFKIAGDVGASSPTRFTVSNGDVYAAWTLVDGGNSQTFLSRSTDGGTTFDDPVDITGRSDYILGDVESSDGNVYVAGGSLYPGDTVWFAASNNYGADFGSVMQLNNNTGMSLPLANVPEFPFVIPILLASVIFINCFHKIKNGTGGINFKKQFLMQKIETFFSCKYVFFHEIQSLGFKKR